MRFWDKRTVSRHTIYGASCFLTTSRPKAGVWCQRLKFGASVPVLLQSELRTIVKKPVFFVQWNRSRIPLLWPLVLEVNCVSAGLLHHPKLSFFSFCSFQML